MITVEFTPLGPPNAKGVRLYTGERLKASVNSVAPHVGTVADSDDVVEVLYWLAGHGWYEKEPQGQYVSCHCSECPDLTPSNGWGRL